MASASEEGAGGVVRSVNVDVAVGATFVVGEADSCGIGGSRNGTTMPSRVALLAETRTRELEHLLLVAAVGVVAVGAALRDWDVLPEERATLLLVTLVARFADRRLDQELFIR